MIALIQRVGRAEVSVAGETIARITAGILAFVCAEREDDEASCHALVGKVLGYRIFGDDRGRMNKSVSETGGALLVVPQFTLAADTHSGMRPSFTPAAEPGVANRLFDAFVARARLLHGAVACGRFGADMEVELVNVGPVTFWLRVPREARSVRA